MSESVTGDKWPEDDCLVTSVLMPPSSQFLFLLRFALGITLCGLSDEMRLLHFHLPLVSLSLSDHCTVDSYDMSHKPV